MMPQDWTNRDVARRWDATGDHRNPLRAEQLDILVHIIQNDWVSGGWILDLGYGSGKVEQLIFQHIPDARVLGIDNSSEMMKLAGERLSEFASQYESMVWDLSQLSTLTVPEHPYRFVIAIQSLHHLQQSEMQVAYRWIYDVLEPGGTFLLLDRVRVETAALWKHYHTLWTRLDAGYNSVMAENEGTDFHRHEQTVIQRGDFPVTLLEHLAWLKEIGFETACLHAHANRALIAGVKPSDGGQK